MIYKDFNGTKVSALGMGCMRFPLIEGDDSRVDMDKTREIIAYAIENGINYFDTAWVYHGGKSEEVMGELLNEYPRDKFLIATKFPGWEADVLNKIEDTFEEQLRRCKVDYFDFYLFHNVCEDTIDNYLNPDYRIFEYLKKQKENGRIRHLGFSTHGTFATMNRFLDTYGADIEFCQLQINWVDWEFQNAKEKVKLVSSYGIPVWVMEPVRGGSLANLKPEYEKILKDLHPDMTNAEWAFRFVQNIPEVVVTLSGMSNLEQVKQNIETFKERKPLFPEETEALFSIARNMTAQNTLPCTSCRYCTPNCPKGLDIPLLIKLYNEHISAGADAVTDVSFLPNDKLPSACIDCKACEAACPQNLKISQMMPDFSMRLR